MRIYVDTAQHRWKGQLWCHMLSPDIEALHLFAERIGMKRAWFQDPLTMPKVKWPHYDVPTKRRAMAVAAGAVEIGRHQVSAMSKVVMNRHFGLEGTDREMDPLGLHRRLGTDSLPKMEAWLARELAMIEGMRS